MKYIGDQIGFFTNFGGKLFASLNLIILTPMWSPNVHSILLTFSFCFDTCVFGDETCARSYESEGKNWLFFCKNSRTKHWNFMKLYWNLLKRLWERCNRVVELEKFELSSKLVHKWMECPLLVILQVWKQNLKPE